MAEKAQYSRGSTHEEGVTIEKTNKKGRWKDRIYSKQLVEYANMTIRPEEKGVYNAFFDDLVDRFKLDRPNDMMLLDIACFDFLRIKRLQKIVADEGDMVNYELRSGKVIKKGHDASYLLNAVQGQFRQTMKELLLTKKEEVKKSIGKDGSDFSSVVANIIEADYKEGDSNKSRRVQENSREGRRGDKNEDGQSSMVHKQSDESVQSRDDVLSDGMAGNDSEDKKT